MNHSLVGRTGALVGKVRRTIYANRSREDVSHVTSWLSVTDVRQHSAGEGSGLEDVKHQKRREHETQYQAVRDEHHRGVLHQIAEQPGNGGITGNCGHKS